MNRLKTLISLLLAAAVFLMLQACSMNTYTAESGDLLIKVDTGSEWLHNHPLIGPITRPNPPTFAIWITDELNNYIDDIYVTKKIGQVAWIANDDPRPEALPLWSSVRGGQPTVENQVPDGLSGATPSIASSFKVSPASGLSRFIIWLEINHSLDYNSFFPEGVNDDEADNYSGGIGGSGQPALVYRADIDTALNAGSIVELILAGHSESGGDDSGVYYADLTCITTAADIIEKVEVEIK